MTQHPSPTGGAPHSGAPARSMLSYLKWAFIVTGLGLALGGWLGWTTTGTLAGMLTILFICAVLAVLEISLSFDNAIVNANKLKSMTPIWQRRFLTWGILIATTAQVTLGWLIWRKVQKMHLIVFVITLIFGSMTLFFQNDVFIKWRPSIISFTLGGILLLGHFLRERNLLQRLCESLMVSGFGFVVALSRRDWALLNIAFVLYFAFIVWQWEIQRRHNMSHLKYKAQGQTSNKVHSEKSQNNYPRTKRKYYHWKYKCITII